MADIFDMLVAGAKKSKGARKTRLCKIYKTLEEYFSKFDEFEIDLVELCGEDFEHYPWWCMSTVEYPLKRVKKGKLINEVISDLGLVEEWFEDFKSIMDKTLGMFPTVEAYNMAACVGGTKEFEKLLKLIKKTWRSRPAKGIPPDNSFRKCPWEY